MMYQTASKGFVTGSPVHPNHLRKNNSSTDDLDTSVGFISSINRTDSTLVLASKQIKQNTEAKSPQIDWRES